MVYIYFYHIKGKNKFYRSFTLILRPILESSFDLNMHVLGQTTQTPLHRKKAL